MYRKRRTLIYAIALMILFLTLFTSSMGGMEPEFSVQAETSYRPYTKGYLNVTVNNRWFTRDLEVQGIEVRFYQLRANYDIISELPVTLKSGNTFNITIELEITEYKQGDFSFDIIINYTQTRFFSFGSDNLQKTLSSILKVV